MLFHLIQNCLIDRVCARVFVFIEIKNIKEMQEYSILP